MLAAQQSTRLTAAVSRSVAAGVSSYNHAQTRLKFTSHKRRDTISMQRQQYDAFLVMDFEATCDQPVQLEPMEIIEFPVLMVNATTWQTESVFHTYVRPTVHPQLTAFCTKLTGIVQDTVDGAPTFDQALSLFDNWIRHEAKLITPTGDEYLKRFTFATCGNWDIQVMLADQCRRQQVRVPFYMQSWINVKHSFKDVTGTWPKSLNHMLEQLNIKAVGRAHSGLDDSKNLLQIMKVLAERGHLFKQSHTIRQST